VQEEELAQAAAIHILKIWRFMLRLVCWPILRHHM